jgi:hypothetical protein
MLFGAALSQGSQERPWFGAPFLLHLGWRSMGKHQRQPLNARSASLADKMQAAITQLVESHDNAANAPTDPRLFAGEVLAQAGALFTAAAPDKPERETSPQALALHGPHLPQWDRQCRVLRVGQCVVKQYRRPSPNQDMVLAAFQKEDWPHRIDDPLPPQGEQEPKCRLHDTIKWLNRHQEHRLIRFLGDGTGEGVCWELINDAAPALPAAAPKQTKKLRPAA